MFIFTRTRFKHKVVFNFSGSCIAYTQVYTAQELAFQRYCLETLQPNFTEMSVGANTSTAAFHTTRSGQRNLDFLKRSFAHSLYPV